MSSLPTVDYEELNKLQTNSESNPLTEARYAQFVRNFPAKADIVLDIGCNNGRGGVVVRTLTPAGMKLYGLDCVKDRLDQIPPNVYEQTFYGLANHIPMESNSVDVVLAGEIIEHIQPGEVDATVAECFRILRVGGRLLLTTPNPGYLRSRLNGGSVLNDGSHLSQHHPHALKLRLEMTGFSNVKLRGSGSAAAYLGERFPFLFPYGLYLASADKR